MDTTTSQKHDSVEITKFKPIEISTTVKPEQYMNDSYFNLTDL